MRSRNRSICDSLPARHNIVSDLIRHPQGKVALRLIEIGEDKASTSIIVAAELRYGAAKRGSTRLTTQMEIVLGALKIHPFESPAEIVYGNLRSRLEAVGMPIGANDLLIAVHAMALGHTVITDNEREFSRIEPLENWLRED